MMNTITTSELRRRLRDVLAALRGATQPYFVTQYSRPVAVIIDVDVFETLQWQAANSHPRIVRRPDIGGGEPILVGTRISVREIVERTRSGQSAQEISDSLPPVTLALVHDALSYYYDFPSEIDRHVSEDSVLKVLDGEQLRAEKVAPGIVRATTV
jgi:prevent-host-death family protein